MKKLVLIASRIRYRPNTPHLSRYEPEAAVGLNIILTVIVIGFAMQPTLVHLMMYSIEVLAETIVLLGRTCCLN